MDTDTRKKLIEHAKEVRSNAHCPYSKFTVGAAVLCASGETYGGVNVENISYGLTMCAERVAMYNAVVGGCSAIVAIAVVTDSDPPTPPCGACRQVMSELAKDANVIFVGRGGQCVETTVAELLPLPFDRFDPAP